MQCFAHLKVRLYRKIIRGECVYFTFIKCVMDVKHKLKFLINLAGKKIASCWLHSSTQKIKDRSVRPKSRAVSQFLLRRILVMRAPRRLYSQTQSNQNGLMSNYEATNTGL